ncbi:hypothetical protein [Streptomyces sp. NPDC086023]|uniref:hypothetical protein n=1 Tax=Streptomyces sp. NPDC086023 TaxID=3365746 RepID=UPI0037CF354A
MQFTRKAAVTCAIFAAAGVLGASALASAQDGSEGSQPIASATIAMPGLVEDFAYPGAAQIYKDRQIKLKRGDGHITLIACGGKYDIMVKSRTGDIDYCFDVNAPQGYLSLELPNAFGMFTEAYPVQAVITSDGRKTKVDASANDYKPFGEAGDTQRPSVLIELRVNG